MFVLALSLAACRPSFDETASLVTTTRVIAVRNDPAEAAPGDPLALTALVASPSGSVGGAAIAWAFCRVPKPLAENDVVSPDCFTDGVMVFGAPGPTVMGTMPSDACALFGSDTPPQMSGQPPQRPRDPDPTGGYFQPVRAELQSAITFQLARVTCSLAEASVDVSNQFRATYKANQNPTLTPLTASRDGQSIALDQIPAAQKIVFAVGWPASAVESYPVLDVLSQTLVTTREAMRVSWFASAGSFDDDDTGRAESDLSTVTSNGWLPPATAGPAHVWVVLHDSRGGTAMNSYDVMVR